MSQLVDFDAAGIKDLYRVFVLCQREQKVLERCIFVVTLIGISQASMKRFLKVFG